MKMRLAQVVFGAVMLAVCALLVWGLVDVARKHGVGAALAIVPGAPLASLALMALIQAAFGPEERK